MLTRRESCTSHDVSELVQYDVAHGTWVAVLEEAFQATEDKQQEWWLSSGGHHRSGGYLVVAITGMMAI